MCALSDFKKFAIQNGLTRVDSADWSEAVTPFWWAVVKSAFSLRTFTLLLQSGVGTIQGALAMFLMIWGFRKRVIVFGVLGGLKKE